MSGTDFQEVLCSLKVRPQSGQWKIETWNIDDYFGELEPDVKANCECACASLGNAVCAGFSIILTAFVKLPRWDGCKKLFLMDDFLWRFLGKAGLVIGFMPGRDIPQINLCFKLSVLTQNKLSRSVFLPVWKTPQSKSSICDFLLPEVSGKRNSAPRRWGELSCYLSTIFSSPSTWALSSPHVPPAACSRGHTCSDAQTGGMRNNAGCFLVRMAWTCRLSSGWDWWPRAELLGRGVEGGPWVPSGPWHRVTMLMQI